MVARCVRLAPAGLAVLLAACAASIPPAAVQAWVGRPAAALERDWGPPTRETPDGERRVLIYEQVTRKTPRDFQAQSATVRDPYAPKTPLEGPRGPVVFVRSYLFWVDAAGTIVHTEIREP